VHEDVTDIPLDGIDPTEVRTGARVDLGRLRGVHVLTLIRHRF
jgi:hypothetical protein